MKHLLRYIWLVIVTLGALGTYVCSVGSGALTALAAEQKTVSMDVTYGYGDAVKNERYLPVRVELGNDGETVFEGSVEIQMVESSFDIYRHGFPVSIKPKTEIQEVYHIPLGIKNDQLYVTLEDNEGNTVLSKRVKLNIVEDVAELYIGTLSDQPESLSFMDGVMIFDSRIRTRILPMSKDDFPEDLIGLDMMDVLLVNGYKINSLNNAQTEALMQWVSDGGTLLLGTGERAADNLGSLGSSLLLMPYEQAVETEVSMGAEYASNNPGDSVITLPFMDINVEDGSEIMSSNELVLMSRVEKGNGSIVLAAYDFADIASFCTQYPSYIGKVFDAVLGESRLEQAAQQEFYGYSNQYWYIQGIVNSGNVDRLPNLVLYAIVIIAYVILVGPAIYFFLKHREMQGAYVACIMAAAFLAAGIIYFMGAGTRFRDRFFTYATIQELSDGQLKDTTYVSVQAPFNKPYSVSFSPEYTVRPVTRSRLYEGQALPKLGDRSDYQVALYSGVEETRVSMRDVKSFDSRFFELTRTESMKEQPEIQADITIYEGHPTGTITNGTEETICGATLLLYGKLVTLGDLAPGETAEVDSLETISYPLSYSYAAAQISTGLDAYKEADVTDPVYMTARRRAELLDFYMSQVLGRYSDGAWVVYFKEGEPNKDRYLVDASYENDGITIYTMKVDVENERNGLVSRSVYSKTPKTISGIYYEEYNSMQGLDPLILEYSLGTDIQVEKLLVESVSEQFKDAEKYPYLTVFSGSMFFYNYETNEYDRADLSQKEFDRKQLEPYLSPDNRLRVRYLPENIGSVSWDVILPMLSVTGRER